MRQLSLSEKMYNLSTWLDAPDATDYDRKIIGEFIDLAAQAKKLEREVQVLNGVAVERNHIAVDLVDVRTERDELVRVLLEWERGLNGARHTCDEPLRRLAAKYAPNRS